MNPKKFRSIKPKKYFLFYKSLLGSSMGVGCIWYLLNLIKAWK